MKEVNNEHPCAFELADYATWELEGYIPLSSSKGLTSERKLEISEHCKLCSHCQKATDHLRDTFQRMPQMGKALRDQSYRPIAPISEKAKSMMMQPN